MTYKESNKQSNQDNVNLSLAGIGASAAVSLVGYTCNSDGLSLIGLVGTTVSTGALIGNLAGSAGYITSVASVKLGEIMLTSSSESLKAQGTILIGLGSGALLTSGGILPFLTHSLLNLVDGLVYNNILNSYSTGETIKTLTVGTLTAANIINISLMEKIANHNHESYFTNPLESAYQAATVSLTMLGINNLDDMFGPILLSAASVYPASALYNYISNKYAKSSVQEPILDYLEPIEPSGLVNDNVANNE